MTLQQKSKTIEWNLNLTLKIWSVFFTIFFMGLPVFAEIPMDEMVGSTVRVLCIEAEGMGTGTGFVIADGEYVVTNWHVVEATASGGKAGIIMEERELNEVTIKWHSAEKDLAVLKPKQRLDRPSVVFVRERNMKMGQTVFALGFPGAADDEGVVGQASMDIVKQTKGSISAKVPSKFGVALYQIDAALNPGNSGGPLFNQYGFMAGINVAKSLTAAVVIGSNDAGLPVPKIDRLPSGEGIAWAIQADELMTELERLNIPYQTMPWYVSNRIYRFWKDDPLFFCIAAMLSMVSLAGFCLGITGRGRVMVKDMVTKGVDALTQRGPVTKARGAQKERMILAGISDLFHGCTIELDEAPLVIGRDPRASHLVFPSDVGEISRRHCIVSLDNEKQEIILEDCWSYNGTFLNDGKRLPPGGVKTLLPGDQFYLSDSRHMFEIRTEKKQ